MDTGKGGAWGGFGAIILISNTLYYPCSKNLNQGLLVISIITLYVIKKY